MKERLKIMHKIRKIVAGINAIAANFSITLFVIMTFIVWAQIFFRFILGDGIVWAEEIAKYMMVWMALIGASVVYYEKGHIAIESFISNNKWIRWIRMIHTVMAAVLFIVLLFYGIKYAQFGQRFISPASGIRRFWPYLSIPVGSGFMIIHCIHQFTELLIGEGKTETAKKSAESEPCQKNQKEVFI